MILYRKYSDLEQYLKPILNFLMWLWCFETLFQLHTFLIFTPCKPLSGVNSWAYGNRVISQKSFFMNVEIHPTEHSFIYNEGAGPRIRFSTISLFMFFIVWIIICHIRSECSRKGALKCWVRFEYRLKCYHSVYICTVFLQMDVSPIG